MNILRAAFSALIICATATNILSYQHGSRSTTAHKVSTFESFNHSMYEKFDTAWQKTDTWVNTMKKKHPRLFIISVSSAITAALTATAFGGVAAFKKIRNNSETEQVKRRLSDNPDGAASSLSEDEPSSLETTPANEEEQSFSMI